MKAVQRCLVILFVSSVIAAVYLSFRDVALPDASVIRAGNHFEADATGYMWRMSLGLFAALGVVWFVRVAVE